MPAHLHLGPRWLKYGDPQYLYGGFLGGKPRRQPLGRWMPASVLTALEFVGGEDPIEVSVAKPLNRLADLGYHGHIDTHPDGRGQPRGVSLRKTRSSVADQTSSGCVSFGRHIGCISGILADCVGENLSTA